MRPAPKPSVEADEMAGWITFLEEETWLGEPDYDNESWACGPGCLVRHSGYDSHFGECGCWLCARLSTGPGWGGFRWSAYGCQNLSSPELLYSTYPATKAWFTISGDVLPWSPRTPVLPW